MHPGPAGRLRRLSPRHRVLLDIERRVFGDPRQRIQCPSRLVADALRRRHGVASDRLLVLPNGVDHRRFAASANRDAGAVLRRRIEGRIDGLSDGKRGPVWLLPGSGWQRKGLDTLLDAWARSDTNNEQDAEHARLWVAGRDDPRPWRARAERLGVADRVRFLGPRADLEIVYAAVDGVVLPTRYDPFANVTLEAAAAGLPIVTSATNGAAEWLGDGVVRLTDAEDPAALADALAALAPPERRRALGERGLGRVAPLTWDAHVEALRAEYARLTVAPRPAPRRRSSRG